MRLNLREVPFSTRGSYMAFSYLEGKYQGKEVENGLYFRTVHGSASSSFLARVRPVYERKQIEYTYEAEPWELRIITDKGTARLVFADKDTIVIRGNLALEFDFMTEGTMYTFAQPW